MDRRTALKAAFSLPLGVLGPAYAGPSDRGARQGVAAWRIVTERDGVHFGIPSDSGRLVISQLHSDAVTTLNLPRAVPGIAGWVPAVAPAQPYVTPEARYSDLLREAAPDEISAVGWDGLRFVIAVNTPEALPVARMPYFLVRVEPGSYALQTYSMPPSARSEPVAIFVRGSLIVLVDHEGAEVTVPRS